MRVNSSNKKKLTTLLQFYPHVRFDSRVISNHILYPDDPCLLSQTISWYKWLNTCRCIAKEGLRVESPADFQGIMANSRGTRRLEVRQPHLPLITMLNLAYNNRN